MPTLAVQITIDDYAKWRPLFDKNKPLRDRAGLRNVRVYRDADKPRELIVWSETADPAKSREALSSPEVRNPCKRLAWWDRPKFTCWPPAAQSWRQFY
jgi:hypothetical protein